MKKITSLLLISLISLATVAQNGFLRGKIIDKELGEGLIGATVVKQGTTTGAVADFDGNYSLTLPVGSHTVVFQFISYQSVTISDVIIKEGEVTTLDVSMGAASTELDEVVVTAEQIKDNEIALLTVQKKSANVVDGISSQTFRKVGDGDLGVAMKRVTGVSVQSGKYVYVRGLGDRYTKTTLNGMVIPGLDPDRNAVQIDIFPTNTVENVVVYKTFTPNLMGDFTGGTVDVETKNFPTEKNTQISFGIGYNPSMHFRSDAIGYKGSSTDFLGFDDGSRALPFSKSTSIPNILAADGAKAESLTKSFSPQLSANRQSNFMNYGLSINHGNQIEKGETTIGYNAMFSYKKTDKFYNKAVFGESLIPLASNKYQLERDVEREGPVGSNDVLWNAMLAGAIKVENHSLSVILMRTQNGTSSATKRISADLDDNPSILQNDILTYTQRSITNGMLLGKHNFEKFKLEWKGAINWSRINDPDFRITNLEVKEDKTFGFNAGVGAGIDRIFRDLNETNGSFKVDLTFPWAEKNKIKAGALASLASRDFEVIEYLYRNQGGIPISGNANDLLKPENIWSPAKGVGMVARGQGLIPSKTYQAQQSLFATYAMTEAKITDQLKAIVGARAEKVIMKYTGEDQNRQRLNNHTTMDNLDILPSANLVYALADDMNLRASFNKTLARPSFKEKSNAQIFDPISGRTFIGNLNLKSTYIDNYDLRWEYFFGKSEMVSVSGFYKNFTGHIEMVSYAVATNNFTPRNAGNSTVVGAEVEFRKNINDKFSFGTNASLIKSAVDTKSIKVDDQSNETEFELRQKYLREGESSSTTRPMAGQAPYLVNAFVNWTNNNRDINANISYNVQGETLNIVGSGRFPDVYTQPFHSLNINVYRDFGTNKKSRVTLGVDNLLGSIREDIQNIYNGSSTIYSRYEEGRTFSLKYSYTF